MKKLVMAACAIFLIPSAFADDEKYSYKAKAEPGTEVYCARVEVNAVGVGTVTRTRCRTIKQWEEAGYSVTIPVVKEQEENDRLSV